MIVLSSFISAGNLFAAQTAMKTIRITAESYTFTPGTINVNQGDRVILKVTATDKDHGFGIKAYNINEVLPKGKTVAIEFVASKKGEFTIKCTKFCGLGHFGMKAKLIVT
jgi:cytochrome c oxidase subunit 2